MNSLEPTTILPSSMHRLSSGPTRLSLVMGLLAAWSAVACSGTPHSNTPDPESAERKPRKADIILATSEGYAIGGHDPVSYFLDGEPKKGLLAISHRWREATWLFSTVAHRDLFVADPLQYAPAYGGWCAYGVAEGYAAESDPENAWAIHEGKLYLNWDAEVARDWRLETATLLAKSEANWPEVRRTLQDGSAEIYWHDSE